MDVYRDIRIYRNENMPPGAFLLLSQSDTPCPFCNAVPTFQLAAIAVRLTDFSRAMERGNPYRDTAALLAHIRAQDAALARLRDALAAMLEKRDGFAAYVETYDDTRWCAYCSSGDDNLVWRHEDPERHDDDCPVAAARALLDGEGGA